MVSQLLAMIYLDHPRDTNVKVQSQVSPEMDTVSMDFAG